MSYSEQDIQKLVAQVLAEMKGAAPAAAPAAPAQTFDIPKKARVAMLTALRKIEIKEFDIPEIGDDEMLVKVEGCGICGTYVHDYKNDPFGIIPVVLGNEGS